MSYDKKQGVMNDSQPYQQISNNTVASTTLDILCSHDIFTIRRTVYHESKNFNK